MSKSVTGAEVKQMILDSGVRCWQVAERWGLAEGNFSRRMRKSFDAAEVQRVRDIIAEIKAAKN